LSNFSRNICQRLIEIRGGVRVGGGCLSARSEMGVIRQLVRGWEKRLHPDPRSPIRTYRRTEPGTGTPDTSACHRTRTINVSCALVGGQVG